MSRVSRWDLPWRRTVDGHHAIGKPPCARPQFAARCAFGVLDLRANCVGVSERRAQRTRKTKKVEAATNQFVAAPWHDRAPACPTAPSSSKLSGVAFSDPHARFVKDWRCRCRANTPCAPICRGFTISCDRARLERAKISALRVRSDSLRVLSCAHRWMTTTVPFPVSSNVPCHPSGIGGSVKRKMRSASIGARLMHPWLRARPK